MCIRDSFKPVKCSEEEDSGKPEPRVPECPVRKPAKSAHVQDKRGAPADTVGPYAMLINWDQNREPDVYLKQYYL